MPVVATCSHCSGRVKVKDELIGKSVKCPKCATPFKVAAEAQESSTETAVTEKKPAHAKTTMGNTTSKTSLAKASPPPMPAEPKKKAAWDKAKDDDEAKEADKFKAKSAKKKQKKDDDEAFDELLNTTQLPDAVKVRVHEEIGLKETGVWVGQPVPKIMMVRAIPKIFAAVFITCFLSIFAGVGLLAGLGLPPLIAIPTLIVLDLIAAMFWAVLFVFMDRKAALATAYVVTNKRCIVFQGRWFIPPEVESVYPDLLTHMRRLATWFFGSEAGDIVFRSVTTITTTHRQRGGSSTSSSTVYYGFLGIASMDEAENIIRNALLRDDDDDDDRPRKKKKRA